MIARCDRTQERWYQPELMRLRGELLLLEEGAGSAAAEAHFRDAMELAGRQGAGSWRLRAAISLARVRRGAGEAELARQELSLIAASFQEGHATSDHQEAARILSA